MNIAVITGASSGMGREFVLALDRQQAFDELWLIARREDRLIELGEKTRAKVRPLCMDLLDPASLDAYKALLEAEKPSIKVLVNAAGFGSFKAFREERLSELMGIVDLNSKVLMAMTHLSLPYMERGGQIYQLGSLSSFQPVPYINVYGAGKAFVLSFSRALNKELEKDGIRVMAVCPGWIRTEFFDHARTDDTISYFDRFYDADQVVKKALKDMEKGKDVSVLGLPVRAQVLLVKLLPHRLVMKIWCKQQKK